MVRLGRRVLRERSTRPFEVSEGSPQVQLVKEESVRDRDWSGQKIWTYGDALISVS